MDWVPIAGFGALGGFFVQKALRRGAKRTWAWGRGGSGPPLSRAAYGIWGITFICIAVVLAFAPRPPLGALLAFGLCFFALAVVGIADTRAYRRRRSTPRRGA
jgi:hypothetical protein